MNQIRVAIAGIGNCASSLLQGIEYYRHRSPEESAGLLHPSVGGYTLDDIRLVAAFDIDRRKVGRPLEEAVFAPPNCTKVFEPRLPLYGVTVQMGPVLDGVAEHMLAHPEPRAFRPADVSPCDVAQALADARADVLLCYVPVGSEQAARYYARACLEAGVALVNCMPAFIASDDSWGRRFQARNIPVIGDDIKSQVGATIVHRVLARLLRERGVKLAMKHPPVQCSDAEAHLLFERWIDPATAKEAQNVLSLPWAADGDGHTVPDNARATTNGVHA